MRGSYMKQVEQQQIVKLIIGLATTNSPKLKYELLADFCLDFPKNFTEFDEATRSFLIKKLRSTKDQAIERGRAYAIGSNAKAAIVQDKNYKHPGFFTSLPDVYCATCDTHLYKRPGFNWKIDQFTWKAYCPMPTCFPLSEIKSMQNNFRYNSWMTATKMLSKPIINLEYDPDEIDEEEEFI